MPIGGYRFRRSFGNVNSRFRGARPDTYPLFTGILDDYPSAAAAYSLRALSAAWLAGDVVEVRRSSDSTAQGFTASQITSGAMLDFVNGGTTDLYNSARYFNGTSTYVSHDTGSTSATFFANKTISAKFILGSTAAQAIHVRGATAERLYVTGGGNFGVGGSTDTGFSVSAGVLYHTELDIDATGKIVELRVNGNTEWTGSVTEAAATSTFYIGARDAGGLGLFLNGTVYDVSITSYLAYTGLGTSVTAWEDTIGSNDGTETNGAAYTGQPFDGFVSTWYDQSGNGNDATQINTARQRQIVSSGSLVLLNEQPALSGAFEYNTSAIALSGDFSIISLGAWNVLDSLLGDQSSSSPRIRTTSGGFQLNIVNNANTAANINIPTQSGSQSMIGIYRNTANLINVPVNTNDPTEGNSATLSGDFTFNRILSRNSGIDPFDGAFQELIIWNRDIR